MTRLQRTLISLFNPGSAQNRPPVWFEDFCESIATDRSRVATTNDDIEGDATLPNYCPRCRNEQTTVLVEATGYARPISAGDRRQRGVSSFIPAWRVASWDPVGRIRVEYECESCGFVVIPGVTHIRNWTFPDYWVPRRKIELHRVRDKRYRERHRRRKDRYD